MSRCRCSAVRLTPPPSQFQTLCESSRLYEPGSQYTEFVKRLLPAARSQRDVSGSGSGSGSTAPPPAAAPGATAAGSGPFQFEPYGPEEPVQLRGRKSNGQLVTDEAARVSGTAAVPHLHLTVIECSG